MLLTLKYTYEKLLKYNLFRYINHLLEFEKIQICKVCFFYKFNYKAIFFEKFICVFKTIGKCLRLVFRTKLLNEINKTNLPFIKLLIKLYLQRFYIFMLINMLIIYFSHFFSDF